MQHTQLPNCLADFESIILPASTTVFFDGAPCENFYFVLEGSIRVDLINADGKSILLYRIGAEETCILSTSCLISEEPYCAEAVTETQVTAVAVPRRAFHRLLGGSQSFRELVFRSFSSRLSKMMAKIDEVSFASLDKRMGKRLLELQKGNDPIAVTHDQLANDLGSAREVVSRKLQEWESLGLITRGRGKVKIEDNPSLRRHAGLCD